jgi:hypothetical protein
VARFSARNIGCSATSWQTHLCSSARVRPPLELRGGSRCQRSSKNRPSQSQFRSCSRSRQKPALKWSLASTQLEGAWDLRQVATFNEVSPGGPGAAEAEVAASTNTIGRSFFPPDLNMAATTGRTLNSPGSTQVEASDAPWAASAPNHHERGRCRPCRQLAQASPPRRGPFAR